MIIAVLYSGPMFSHKWQKIITHINAWKSPGEHHERKKERQEPEKGLEYRVGPIWKHSLLEEKGSL